MTTKHRQRPGGLVPLGVNVDASLRAAFDASGPANLSRAAKVAEALSLYIAQHSTQRPAPIAVSASDEDVIAFEDE